MDVAVKSNAVLLTRDHVGPENKFVFGFRNWLSRLTKDHVFLTTTHLRFTSYEQYSDTDS